MVQRRFNLLSDDTPLIFADGSEVYEKLAKEYTTHKCGYFILAPSGSGKTHFIEHQQQKDWIDGDVLWMTTNAHPEGEWWQKSVEEIQEIERRSDIITMQAKALGFWIIGSDCYSIIPDAIVILDWETHQKYIRHREKNNYDGGATTADFERVKNVRKWISTFEKQGVPRFESVQDAAEYLAGRS